MADKAEPTPAVTFMIDPGGQTVPVTADTAQDALAQGYTVASPDQVKDYQLQQKYGQGLGNQFKAFGAGVLRGPSLGTSDKALTALGISTPEALQARQKLLPGESMGGELTGIVGAALLTGGASAEAEAAAGAGEAASGLKAAARFIPSNLVSSAGKMVERGVGSVVPEAGTSLVSKVLANALPKAAGSAIEGAAYAGGHEVSEAALGDPDQTAESVMAHVGLGALMGGGLGGLLGVGEEVIPAAVSKARESVSDIYGKGRDLLGKAYKSELGQKLTGMSGDTAQLLLDNRATIETLGHSIPGFTEELTNATPEMKAWMLENGQALKGAETAFPGLTKQLARVDPQTADFLLENYPKIITDPQKRIDLATQMRSGMQEVMTSATQVFKKVNTDFVPAEEKALLQGVEPQKVAEAYGKTFDSINSAVEQMRAEPELFNQSQARALEKIQEGLVRDADQSLDPLEAFRRLKTLRQQIGDNVTWKAGATPMGLAERNSNNLLKDLYHQVKGTITDEATFGEQAARRAALDEAQTAWNKLTTGKGAFRKMFIDADGKVSTTKIDTWLNAMAKDKGTVGAEAWGQLVDAAKSITDEAEKSYRVAPVGEFDHQALTDLINKHADAVAEGRQAAEVTAKMKYLKSGGVGIPNSGPYGTGDAVAAGLDQGMGLAKMMGVGAVAHNPLLAAPIAAGKVILGARNVTKTVATLAKLERIGNKVGDAIESGVRTIVRGGVKASYVGRGQVAAGLAAHAARSYEEQTKAYEKLTQRLQQLRDFDQLHGAISGATGDLYGHAPDTAGAVASIASRQAEYLAGVVPVHEQAGPLASYYWPTPLEMGRFNRHVQAVHKPLSIMKMAAAGTLQPEHVHAVKSVYPKLFGQMQRQIMASLPKDPSKVPYRSRAGISMILGVPADGSTSPRAIRANQAAFSPIQPQRQSRPSAPAFGKMTLSNRLQTPSQSASNRGR